MTVYQLGQVFVQYGLSCMSVFRYTYAIVPQHINCSSLALGRSIGQEGSHIGSAGDGVDTANKTINRVIARVKVNIVNALFLSVVVEEKL